MSNNNYFTIDITIVKEEQETKTFSIDITDSVCTKEDVLEQVIEAYNEQDDVEPIETLSDDEYEIDWLDVPEWARDFDILSELMPEFSSSSYDIEVFEAAHDCDVPFSDVDDAYNGEYKDDEDFAYETAMSLGAIDKHANWPYTCIDWEQAARELMMDYSEANGHYFRNF